MSLRVVLLTRSGRPSGAQMAWRLFQSGIPPIAVLVEKRARMTAGKKRSVFPLVRQFGFYFLWKRVWEAAWIRLRYFARRLLKDRLKDPAYRSIEEWALDHPSVPVIEVEDHNGEETRELLWRLEPDIGVLTNTRRIQKSILDLPRHGFLNLHLSALPQYGGLDSIFWALYHGEKEIGITVHFASEEIDRGDIVLQKRIPVSSWDDEESLYQKALWLGTRLMVRALRQLEDGILQRIPQDPLKASYFTWPSPRERREARRLRKKRNLGIVHVITRMILGGAQENTLATVLGLRERGYPVVLVTGPSWGKEGELLSRALEEGLEVKLIPSLIRDLNLWKDLKAFLELSFWLARNPCAIIHTHTSKAGFLGRLAARGRGIPAVVHTPHGHVFHSYFHPWKEKLFLELERRAAFWTNRLIALTERCRLEHLERGVGRKEQWIVVPSGVCEGRFQAAPGKKQALLNRFKVPSNQRIFGFVGRLAPVKGAEYLAEALPQILEKFPEAHCFFVGDGEERLRLQRRVEALGLLRKVIFTGQQEEVNDFLSVFDILVVPSLNEGMGRVIVEAGLLGKAVVGTRVGGIPDLIEEGRTGLLVEPRNASALAEATVRLLESPELSKSLGEALEAKVRSGFRETQMVDQIESLYRHVLKEKGISEDQEVSYEDQLAR